VLNGLTIQFQDAGHILGSAIVTLFIHEHNVHRNLVFRETQEILFYLGILHNEGLLNNEFGILEIRLFSVATKPYAAFHKLDKLCMAME
jgi:predicted metal-dependent RNase